MGRITSFVAARWKLLLNIVTIIALVVTLYFIRGDLETTFKNLLKVDGWALVLMVPFEALNYHAQTKLYQHLFSIVGNKLEYKPLFIASLELNFVNHVFPSGGAAGISYFGLRLKGGEITGAKATLIQFMKLVLTLLSFEALIILSLLFLAVAGKVSNLTILVAAVLSTVLVIGSLLFIYIIGDKKRINAFLGFVTIQLNRLLHRVKPSEKDVINVERAREVFDDFHLTYLKMRQDHRKMRAPLMYALLANITEVAVVYVVFVAFGQMINPGAVILAYGIANFAGFVSVLPGGVGIYETLMVGVLLTTGVPAKISLPVIIMYRVLNTLLQLPPGYYLYQKYISQHGKPPKTAEIL